MLRKEVHLALNLLAGHLPSRGLVFYVRRATTDGSFLRLAGDVRGLTGWTSQEWMGRGGAWRAYVHPDDVEKVEACLRDLNDFEERTLEYRFLTPDGGERWVRDSLRPVAGTPGGPLEVLGVIRDASLERTLRSQVAALEERIWESQRMESLGALAGGVAHDFNNLLTTILTTIQLLEHDAASLGPAGRRDLRMIREAADRGSGMVRQILRFVARREHQTGPVDVNRVVGDLEGILRRRLGPGVQLELRLAESMPEILSDPAQLEQVILNLAVNAREAMPDGGSVRVETSRVTFDEAMMVEGADVLPAGDYVRISVSDTGQGIPLEVRDRIFEPFFTTKAAGGGSGFGLSTVQRIVRGHGGGIKLETKPSRGAVFHIHLPVRQVLVAQTAPEMAAASLPQPVSGVRVLVVEDDPSVRELMRRSLLRDGHAVASVGTAAEALRAFDGARPPFDVAVIDVVLPDRSGPMLSRALRRRHPKLGVVYASGYGELVTGGEIEPGFFLAKPFTPDDLLAAIQRALAGVAPAAVLQEFEEA